MRTASSLKQNVKYVVHCHLQQVTIHTFILWEKLPCWPTVLVLSSLKNKLFRCSDLTVDGAIPLGMVAQTSVPSGGLY